VEIEKTRGETVRRAKSGEGEISRREMTGVGGDAKRENVVSQRASGRKS